MTEAMPFLQKTILLSYDPRPFVRCVFCGLLPVVPMPKLGLKTMVIPL